MEERYVKQESQEIKVSSLALIKDSPAVEFVEELKLASDEVVVKKYSYDCFYQTAGITEAGSSALILKRGQAIWNGLNLTVAPGYFINADSQGKDATATRRYTSPRVLKVLTGLRRRQGSDDSIK
jgi:hypothetical protein